VAFAASSRRLALFIGPRFLNLGRWFKYHLFIMPVRDSLDRRLTRRLPKEVAASKALGALALGAVAIGALAIGALAIGRLTIGRARIGRLEIDELLVRRLRVIEELQAPPKNDPEK